MSASALRGKVAVITGAGGGIGEAVALALAAHGVSILANDLGTRPDGTGQSSDAATRVVAKVRAAGGAAVANGDSVASARGGERIVEAAIDHFGRLDILVNAAGIIRPNFIWDMSEEDWDFEIGVNLKGTWACCRAAAIVMRAQRSGRIVNMASDLGLVGAVSHCGYSASKAGVIAITRVLALELGPNGVTANAICPSATTRLTAVNQAYRDHQGIVLPERVRAQQEKFRDPAHIATMVVYLAKEENANVNGQVFRVMDGAVSLFSHPAAVKTIFKQDGWALDELGEVWPRTLGEGMVNPAPPHPLPFLPTP